MEFFTKLFHLIFGGLGDDAQWRGMIDYVGIHSLYIVLFAIVFCETGLVVTPFLPGDSLIFAVGAVAGRDVGINIWAVAPLLVCAALVGDNVNYWLGRRLGPAVFKRQDAEWTATPESGKVEYATPLKQQRLSDRLLNRKHLDRAQTFYEKYGSKTVILARFVPIVRTFAPFVAGIGKMNYVRFLVFSLIGACAWVSICLCGGYFLGSRPFFKKHFELVIVAIVAISLIPIVIEFLKHRSQAKAQSRAETISS